MLLIRLKLYVVKKSDGNTIYSTSCIKETVIFRIDTYVRLNMIESTAYF